jgi:very-short-patch-repair endonuclease
MTDHDDKIGPRMRGTTAAIQQAAVKMRWNPTPAESALWEALRGSRVAGLCFRRQHPVGRFILDFYCPAKKLVVEVDGGVHDDQAAYDDARTAQIEAYGYHVLRFRNEQVLADIQSVLDQIAATAAAITVRPRWSPPPHDVGEE